MCKNNYRQRAKNNKEQQSLWACLALFCWVSICGRDTFVFTYSLVLALGAAALFLYGFFPIRYPSKELARMTDIPNHVELVSVKVDELYKPIAKKIVIMVIDALRWDFVVGPISTSAMPTISRLLRENGTCLMQARSDPPTVTMPRIKAMMTGAAPCFADVVLNLGDRPALGDSVPVQAKHHGHSICFYGDDTWIKLFPDVFKRYEGTTSFFVTDFTEVDNNVTRNLSEELDGENEWSVLILHYLGLDHIGHVAGPFSPLVKPKLREMDDIVARIEKKIRFWNENGLPAIFVICGDHGMKDSGGHGGSSLGETLVPFLVIGATCESRQDRMNRISQLDVAPILSVMLGTPIPASNVGSVPPVMLNGRSNASKLFVMYYNAQQVLKHFKSIPDWETHEAYNCYKNAISLHVHWLTSPDGSNAVQKALLLYDEALQKMKELLIRSAVDYDLHAITIAMIFMAHAIYMLTGEIDEARGRFKKYCWMFMSVASYIILRYLWEPETFGLPTKSNGFTLNTIALGICVLNSNLAARVTAWKFFAKRILTVNRAEVLLPLATFVHTLSLFASSFVEEEHQTWYFYWTTLLVLLWLDFATERWNRRLEIQIFLLLAAHRVLRKLNSTGNKYANAPSIVKWLKYQEDNWAVTILLFSVPQVPGRRLLPTDCYSLNAESECSTSLLLIRMFFLQALGLLVWIGHVSEERRYRSKSLIIHIGAAICVYLRHAANGDVVKLPFDFDSRGIVEVRIFWMIVTLHILYCAYRLLQMREIDHRAGSFLKFTIQSWIMILALLHRAHNVILVPVQILSSFVIHRAVGTSEAGQDAILYIYIWMGNVFYFYQGNSNSLATIDVAAGYVGMESYRPVITTLLMSINAYSAPVLAYLILLYRSTLVDRSNKYYERILSINRNCALWRLFPLAVYTVIVTVQRFHLFIWTVFSPKVFYEAMHCAVMFITIFLMQFAFFCMKLK